MARGEFRALRPWKRKWFLDSLHRGWNLDQLGWRDLLRLQRGERRPKPEGGPGDGGDIGHRDRARCRDRVYTYGGAAISDGGTTAFACPGAQGVKGDPGPAGGHHLLDSNGVVVGHVMMADTTGRFISVLRGGMLWNISAASGEYIFGSRNFLFTSGDCAGAAYVDAGITGRSRSSSRRSRPSTTLERPLTMWETRSIGWPAPQ